MKPETIYEANKKLIISELEKDDPNFGIIKHLLKATMSIYNNYIKPKEDVKELYQEVINNENWTTINDSKRVYRR